MFSLALCVKRCKKKSALRDRLELIYINIYELVIIQCNKHMFIFINQEKCIFILRLINTI